MAKKKIKARKYAPGGSLAALADTSGITSIPNLGGPQRTPLNFGNKLQVLNSRLGGVSGAAANSLVGIANNFMNPNGVSTGVGNALQSIGSVASNIPGVGGIVGAGVNFVGGLVNSLFGSKINEEFVNQTKQNTANQAGYYSTAQDNTSLLSDWSSHQDLSHVSQDEVGHDGLFSNKAKNLTKELNRKIDQANFRAWSSLANTAANVDANNDLNIMSNFAANGGPLTMRYSGVMSPFGNQFKDGGGIHIKKENRGKFTEYCGGKVTSECIARGKRNSSPTIRKRATFAANARKWKHADGGWLDEVNNNPLFNLVKFADPTGISSYYDVYDAGREMYNNPSWSNAGALGIEVLGAIPLVGKLGKAVKIGSKIAKGEESMEAGAKTLDYLSTRLPSSLKDGHDMQQYRENKKAEGGPLFTHGGIWDNGLTYINEGSSHEENPFEGIQMGVDPQGIPNLVEEGEVVYNDYVFSNRLTVPKDLKKKYKIKGKTYADAAKYMSKESEERPNDYISKKGLEASMNILTNSQEEMRNKKNNHKYSHGGKLGNLFDGLGEGSQNLKTYSNFTRLSNDDFYTPEYMDFWNWYNNNSNTEEGKKWLQRINSGEFGQIGGNTFNAADISRLAHDYKKGPVHNAFSEAAKQFNKERKTIKPFAPFGINDAVDTEALKGLEVPLRTPSKTSENSKGKEEVEEDKGNPLTWLRYAPVLGSAVGLGYDLFSKPDYSSADAVLEAATDTGNYMPVQANPIGNYLAYRPFDRMFYINQLNANNAAGRRAIQNTSGGNRAAAMAGILASDYNYGNSLGNLARQAEEYNLAQRERVENFNRGTNMFNSEQDLKAQMANQSALARARASRLSGVAQAMAMRDAIDNRRSASLSANFTNLFDSLGNIGREEVMKDWINDNPALYYDISTGGRGLGYKGNDTRAKGGYITIKNKKRRK